MTSPLTAHLEEVVDEETVTQFRETLPNEPPNITAPDGAPVTGLESTASPPSSWGAKLLERLARRIGYRHIVKLAKNRGNVTATFDQLPARMHLVANQTRLILSLIDDFRTGEYREVPWRSIAVGAAALLYVVSPVDVIPDILGGLGIIDDLAVLAAASRLMRKDLEAYCAFKGYDLEEYFGRKQ